MITNIQELITHVIKLNYKNIVNGLSPVKEIFLTKSLWDKLDIKQKYNERNDKPDFFKIGYTTVTKIKRNKMRVICGFPGVGKSTLVNDINKCYENIRMIDLDSSQFDKSDFPRNYIEHIQEKLSEGYWVLCSTHADVRKALQEEDIGYVLVVPAPGLKDEYMERYKNRNSPEAFIKLMDTEWDNFINDVYNDKYGYIFSLFSGQYLDTLLKHILRQENIYY